MGVSLYRRHRAAMEQMVGMLFREPEWKPDEVTMKAFNCAWEAAEAISEQLATARDQRRQNATLPRRNIMTLAEIDAKIESYCQHMIDIGDLPGNPGWTVTLAQWEGEHGKHRRFAQWRDFAQHLAERRISKADMLKRLREWKPKRR